MSMSSPQIRIAHLDDVRLRVAHLAEVRRVRWAVTAVALILGVLLITELAAGRGALLGLAAVAVAAVATGVFVLREEEAAAEVDEQLAGIDDWWAD
jgi:hypothetical protein